MAVIKLSSSMKQLQFIDDQGNMFVCALSAFHLFVAKGSSHEFILLNRMPIKVSPDRFKVSPVWMPSGMTIPAQDVDSTNDGLSKGRIEAERLRSKVDDKDAW